MTAASVPTRKATNRSGLWTFLRLLGGWATVAVLAYLLWMPSQDFGWLKMVFVWVLLALLADEFAGWFGYIGLALGLLPFLYQTPEQWFVVFPLLAGAMGAYLIVKHSGGPFVLPFAAALFAGAVLAAARFGVKLDPTLKLPANSAFQQAALMPMLGVTAFSFVRQLVAMIVRGSRRRREVKARQVDQMPTQATDVPVQTTSTQAASGATAPVPTPAATNTLTEVTTISAEPELTVQGQPVSPTSAIIDLDLDEVTDPPSKG